MKVKCATIFFVATTLVASVGAQASKTKPAVRELRKAHPTVNWNSKSAIVADVTCDGKPDTVVLGSDKNDVVIGVVSGDRPNKTEVLSFPVKAATQDGFCSFPTRIETSPLACQSDQGALPGCKPNEDCRAFTVVDDDCDPFNFYWDSSRKTLAWWRN
jgi:hypothetical protein